VTPSPKKRRQRLSLGAATISLDDKTPEYFDYPPTNFIACLTNDLRGAVSAAKTSAEFIASKQTLQTTLPDGRQVDLLAILENSLERAEGLLDLATKYVDVHPQTGKSKD
jgi:hypothetical protein